MREMGIEVGRNASGRWRLPAIALCALTLLVVAAPTSAAALDEGDSQRRATEHELIVQTTGFGWVTGPGIDCPGDSCQATYPAGTSVTLYAHRTAGSLFAGWGGDCSDHGPCELVIDGDRFVTATFHEPPPVTQITRQQLRSAQRKATFWFEDDPSNLGQSDYYRCRLDGKPWQRCASPKTYRNLAFGRHVFRVRGVGPDRADPTPARRIFRIRATA